MRLNPPPTGFLDDPFPLIIDDLTPGALATITTTLTDAAATVWTSEVELRADDTGTIDTSAALPVHADWATPDERGIIWTAQAPSAVHPFIAPETAMTVHVSVRSEGKGQGSSIMRRTAPLPASERTLRDAPRVVVIGDDPHPLRMAGFNAVAIPVKDGIRAVSRAVHTSEPVAVIGHGAGAEMALVLAEQGFPGAVIAHSPSPIRTRDDDAGSPFIEPRFHKPLLHHVGYLQWPVWGRTDHWENTGQRIRNATVDAEEYAAFERARIHLPASAGPVLLTGGSANRVIAMPEALALLSIPEMSARELMQGSVEQPIASESLELDTQQGAVNHLVLDGAGHLCGYPFAHPALPQLTRWGSLDLGGTLPANGRAAHTTQQVTLQFLRQYFGMDGSAG